MHLSESVGFSAPGTRTLQPFTANNSEKLLQVADDESVKTPARSGLPLPFQSGIPKVYNLLEEVIWKDYNFPRLLYTTIFEVK